MAAQSPNLNMNQTSQPGVQSGSVPSIPPVFSPPPPPPPHQQAQASNQPQGASSAVGLPGSTTTQPKRGRGLLKFFLIILLLLVVGGAIAFAVINKKVPLPGIGTPLGEVSVTWWGLWEDDSIIAPLITEYEESHPGVKIKYLKQSKEDYRRRLDSVLAKGEDAPDIFRFHNTWVPMFAQELDPVPSSVMSAAEYSQTYYPVIASDATSGSNLVGIPLGFDTISLFVNLDIFESFAKNPPKTWDELKETALQLTLKDEQQDIVRSGVAMGLTQNVDHWQEILALLMLQNGVKMSNPTGEFAEDALEYFTSFATVNKTWDATLPNSTLIFANGKLAMLLAPSWRVFEIDQINPNLRYKVYPVPQIPKDEPGKADITYASYWLEGVWSRSSVKKQAWDFLKFVSSKESLQKLYQNQSKVRRFGEPYPRADMASLLASDPFVGAFVEQGPKAQSWYLVSRTFDGETGINSRISKYFEDAVNTVVRGQSAKTALETAAQGVTQVLVDYGLVAAPVPAR